VAGLIHIVLRKPGSTSRRRRGQVQCACFLGGVDLWVHP
jgi:hypothetical protein